MSELGARIEGTRKLLQDLIAPEVGILIARMNALEKRIEDMLTSAEERTGAKTERVDAKVDRVEERLIARVDALEQRVNARVDKLEAKVDARFNAVDTRIDKLEANMDARFASVDARFASVDARFDALERTMKENQSDLMRQFSTLINFAALSERMNRLEDKTRSLGPGPVS